MYRLTAPALIGVALGCLPARSDAQQQQEVGKTDSGTASAVGMYSTSDPSGEEGGPEVASAGDLPDAPLPQSGVTQSSSAQQATGATAGVQNPVKPGALAPLPQPRRILGLMPNYRAVSAGIKAPPPTTREAFAIASQQSFDYSAFVFVALTSLLAEGDNAHPSLGKGVHGYWRYYWRGDIDKTDGNYWVYAILPIMLHEDERYYAMGVGGVWKRGFYAATRVLITPNYQGKNTFNAAELLGRGVSQAISLSYYPDRQGATDDFTEKFAYAVGRDALANVFREFWPDIDKHVLHHHWHHHAPKPSEGTGSGMAATDGVG
ncbi:MAG: hypothetical protein ACP5E5_08370 [Acidobacteriaceae bacterium]